MRVVLITAPPDRAEELAATLVREGLAACANLVPGITSIYTWEGKLHRDPETLLVVKTREERLPDLTRRVRELHPYTVPEVIALPVLEGNPDYLDWVRRSTGGGPATPS